MPTFTITPNDQSTEYTPQQVIDFLATKGVTATDVRVTRTGEHPDTAPFSYTITADADPAAALSAGFTPPQSAEQQALAYIKQTFPVLRDATQSVTQAQLRQYLVALTIVVRGAQG